MTAERDKAFAEWRMATAALLKTFEDWDKAIDAQGKVKAQADFDKHFPVWEEAYANFVRLDKLQQQFLKDELIEKLDREALEEKIQARRDADY
jgi:pterin-4a-carbinolamine dehydratase